MIPFNDLRQAHAEIRLSLEQAVDRVIDSGIFLGGDEVRAFEEEWSRYCGVEHTVACASGTDALMLAAYNHCGSGFNIQANGCKFTNKALEKAQEIAEFGIVMQDVNEHGMMGCTFPALPTLLYGRQTILISSTTPRAFPDVVDACQAHGWKPPQKITAAWSFYPTKNLGCFGDGGAITTNDIDVFAISRNILRDWHSRMSELNAAVLRTKLPHLDRWNAERAAVAEVYYNELPDWAEPACRHGEPTNHHIFAVLVERRNDLEMALKGAGIGTKCHYPTPLAELPGARRWCDRVLSLPMFPGLMPKQVREVCDVMRTFGG